MKVRGWVYVLTNNAMPSLLKVGYSLKDPCLRANELENAGLPHPYIVQYEVFVYEPREIEQRVHSALSDFRDRKEWFRCSLGEAVTAIRNVIGNDTILLETIYGDVGEVGRFIAHDNGMVLDTRTKLMWAGQDNENYINWAEAMAYCENYDGGGYKDWRMPTLDELEGLYDIDKSYTSGSSDVVHLTELIRISCAFLWSSDHDGVFNFSRGARSWFARSNETAKVLPVRSSD